MSKIFAMSMNITLYGLIVKHNVLRSEQFGFIKTLQRHYQVLH